MKNRSHFILAEHRWWPGVSTTPNFNTVLESIPIARASDAASRSAPCAPRAMDRTRASTSVNPTMAQGSISRGLALIPFLKSRKKSYVGTLLGTKKATEFS